MSKSRKLSKCVFVLPLVSVCDQMDRKRSFTNLCIKVLKPQLMVWQQIPVGLFCTGLRHGLFMGCSPEASTSCGIWRRSVSNDL